MKLVVTLSEALTMIGSPHGISSQDVEITGILPVSPFAPTPQGLENAVRDLLTQCKPNNKITLIKATRAILGIGLKEAKDLVEGVVPGAEPRAWGQE